MSNNVLLIFIGVCIVLFIAIVIAFLAIRKKLQNDDIRRIQNLRKGTEHKDFSWDVFYQKLYVKYIKTPFISTYLLKIRRRVEINNIDDEFTTRLQSSKIITKTLFLVALLTIAVVLLTYRNPFLMCIILIFELFIIDTFTDSQVNKLDNNLLQQQVDFFAAMRHSYHETNMVAEAIYQTAQDTEHIEVARQAEVIYNILNSADPETELEKYYDIAPNNYLREFAGVSYLTQEFGDRKSGDTSLYLSNLENITQEMQLEILKRDKLNYTFQSLSLIAIAPTILMEPLKRWAVGNFAFTKSFYEGSKGLLVQILIMVLTFICYILIRKLKDNGSTKIVENDQNPWEEKLYKFKPVKQLVDLFIPIEGSKEDRKIKRVLKDAGSKKKTKWLYVDKLVAMIVAFVATISIFLVVHQVEVSFVYNEPTTDYNLIGEMSEREEQKAIEKTKRQNVIIKSMKGDMSVTIEDVKKVMTKSKEYRTFSEDDIETEAKQILKKLKIVNQEFLKWFEVLIGLFFAYVGYEFPSMLLKFQVKLRQMLMEDEVMSYQTIILMLMRIERVDVEMILEWLERYADIFKEPIGKCLNNYESGGWEALEEMKDEVSYEPFIRIIESLQSSVERVPIREAFEELDTDKNYYREKRKETNERLISRKGLIGKAVGFTPMVVTFVGYLIVPLILIGMTSMTSSFDSMSKMS